MFPLSIPSLAGKSVESHPLQQSRYRTIVIAESLQQFCGIDCLCAVKASFPQKHSPMKHSSLCSVGCSLAQGRTWIWNPKGCPHRKRISTSSRTTTNVLLQLLTTAPSVVKYVGNLRMTGTVAWFPCPLMMPHDDRVPWKRYAVNKNIAKPLTCLLRSPDPNFQLLLESQPNFRTEDSDDVHSSGSLVSLVLCCRG